MAKKYCYLFSEGNANMRELLGGKGANLAEMTNIGLPVPQGFTITTEACTQYYEDGREINDEIMAEINEYIVKMEEITGKKFGDKENPLLVSVRSGARASMPGMMDTILNLGLNEDVVNIIAEKSNNPRWAWDCYRRFIQMYSDVVMEVGKKYFEQLIDAMKEKKGVKQDVELTADDLKELASQFKAEYKEKIGEDFPTDPKEQLMGAIKAVFRSWDNPRANVYRRDNDIPYSWGTAVNVQSMAFGNMGDDCGTGVAFTRDPATGAKGLFGEFLTNAQGEDVVAGVRTPMKIAEMEQKFPEAFAEFTQVCKTLEDHYRDMQDMEFTVEHGKLYMLQTRNGKRTAQAALQIACDLVDEGMRTPEEAVEMIDPRNLDTLLHPQFDASKRYEALASGLNASPGAAVGEVVFSSDDAVARTNEGHKVILVRWETNPDDLKGMVAAEGILTSHGGKTSHAAVIARGMGTPCVCGVERFHIDAAEKVVRIEGSDRVLHEGDVISIDGTQGIVVDGAVDLVSAELTGDLDTILSWADEIRLDETCGHANHVRVNADNPEDAELALEFGAEAIGLCRTEHMFLGDRKNIIQSFILSDDEAVKQQALADLLKVQTEDFLAMFKTMSGRDVVVRLLDPPLHEFLDNPRDLEVAITKKEAAGASEEELAVLRARLRRIDGMVESNPMLGLRGVRLSVVFSDLPLMQVRAVATAAARLIKEGVDPRPEIMVPLVSITAEHVQTREVIERVIAEVSAEEGVEFNIPVGTMLELPRACMVADEIAHHADFFCFGTNDLTQMTFGFSRDDAEAKFIPLYMHKKILKDNPFETIDTAVLELVRMAVEKGRATNPDMHFGVCGEHGGDPKSIKGLFNVADVDYVSCSPYRVPLARLAAAQAKL